MRAEKQVARRDVTGESLGDLPERIEVMRGGGLPVFGYVGLKRDGDRVDVRLFKRPDEARARDTSGLGAPMRARHARRDAGVETVAGAR